MTPRETALHVARDVFPADAPQDRNAQESLEYRAQKGELDVRDRAPC